MVRAEPGDHGDRAGAFYRGRTWGMEGDGSCCTEPAGQGGRNGGAAGGRVSGYQLSMAAGTSTAVAGRVGRNHSVPVIYLPHPFKSHAMTHGSTRLQSIVNRFQF